MEGLFNRYNIKTEIIFRNKLDYNGRVLIVCDENTEKFINISGDALVLNKPKANEENVARIIEKFNNHDIIIGFGSGTINDLCKFTSHKIGIDYGIFAAAPSMNGYLSQNASIEIAGVKKSILCHLPKFAVFDLDVLSNAPEELIKAGIGDSICRATCQFDWLLSNIIIGSYYSNEPFDLLKGLEEEMLKFDDFRHPKFIELLVQNLLLSGIGMYISGGSYPASQGEHLICHYLNKDIHHGLMVSVATITTLKMQKNLLGVNDIKLKFTENQIQGKIVDRNRIDELNNIDWIVELQDIHNDNIEKMVQKFRLPSQPSDLGISEAEYQNAVENAYKVRDRFTILDLVRFL